ncbi:MAG TPA: methyltransferase domain-containing protein [Acidimicrobiales bacterium]
MTTDAAAAYSVTGGAWQEGPGRIYDRLAEVLAARCPVPLKGCRVLDVGAGTGAVTRAVLGAGASGVVAIDVALGMLAYDAARRPPAVVGDAVALPFDRSTFDAAVAAFSLNHLAAPADGLREMARVTRPGGALLAAAYATDDTHPVKAAVEDALAARGWSPQPWYAALRTEVTPLMATVEGCAAAAKGAGLDARVELIRVPFPELDRSHLIDWRLGMAQHAPFLTRLSPDDRAAVSADALARLGDATEPLVRSILVLQAIRT